MTMWKTLAGGRARLFAGDCRDAIEEIPSNSIDAVSCDPPYELASVVERFGKEGAAPAKHGTDGLFARASAGFMGQKWDTGEVAFDPEFWKEVLRVLKPGGHVLAMGGTRTYHRLAMAIELAGFDIRDQLAWCYGTGFPKSHDEGEGRGTALKPSWEPIVLARKNLSEKTIAANLERWGTGALWIDRSRVPTDEKIHTSRNIALGSSGAGVFGQANKPGVFEGHPGGRWPANIVTDGSEEVFGAFGGGTADSPARFFYSAKATKTDRVEGTEHLAPPKDAKRTNWHPTVKPTPLCEWMNGLITPPGGVILDPFMGSGSTGKAAIRGGFQFIGCEMTPEYMPIAEARIAFEATKHVFSAPEEAQEDY